MFAYSNRVASKVKAFTCRLKTCGVFTYKRFCDQSGPYSRTGILEKGIELRRVMNATEGTVLSLSNLSPTVKAVKLFVQSNDFTFKAGQWVDFLVPNMKEVAGYSISSTPKKLSDVNEIDLAVKFSDFPPTKWIHEECKVGSKVGLVVGGDFFYAPQPATSCRDLLLVAGGVGINPIVSIIQHVSDLKNTEDYYLPSRVVLAYSARTFDELIFRDVISEVVANNVEMKAEFFVTQFSGNILENSGVVKLSTNQRLDRNTLASILHNEFTNVKNIDCYLCGPSSMIDDVDRILLDLHVPNDQIKYEKWW